MDLFIGFFCLFIFVCFVVVLVISFLLRRISVLQWQLEATSGAWNHAFREWQRTSLGLPLAHVTVPFGDGKVQ